MVNKLISFFFFFFFFFFLFLLCIYIPQSDARQSDALDNLMKLKKKKMMIGASASQLYESRIMSPDEVLVSQVGSKGADKIDELPGQPRDVDFTQYAGYVTVDDKAGRALFYYFAEAVGSNHSSKPLLLWLNGGPGCSSFGYGAMDELGPFRVKSDGRTLYRNHFSWNNVANVLFLESPAGVGFSYSNTTTDYALSGDSRTAKDAYVFLVNWLERFPEYKGREFYLSGESYAGHYVPQLAHAILQQNELANKTIINLKGIAIGNALINDETDEAGMYDFFWSHALVSDEAIDGIHKYCDFSPNATSENKLCNEAFDEVTIGSIDIYNIYAPLCFSNLTSPPKEASAAHCGCIYGPVKMPSTMHSMEQIKKKLTHTDLTELTCPCDSTQCLSESVRRATVFATGPFLFGVLVYIALVLIYDPCSDVYIEAYLNQPQVQEALHANVTKLDHSWSGCSGVISKWNDSPDTILPLLEEFMSKGLRVWVYSGDVDGRIPVTSTRYSLNKLKLPVKTPWKPWYINQEVGGYSVVYNGDITLVTVRGAGHEVPTFQPIRALAMIKSFLQGKPLSPSTSP